MANKLKSKYKQGDCCGYSDITAELLISDTELVENPVITNIEEEDTSSKNCNNAIKITFFGLDKALASIESESGSGSGWEYGACSVVRCVETNEVETITEW